MRWRVLATPWQWLAMLLFTMSGAFAQPVAVLLDAGPGASVKGSSGAVRAGVMHRLAEKDELQLAAQARVVLLMLGSGDEWQIEGPAAARVEAGGPVALSGNAPSRRNVAAGREVRVSAQRLVQGGLVLRTAVPPPLPVPKVGPEIIAQRRPPAGSPVAERVAWALWLEEVDALAEAKAEWRALAVLRPDEPLLVERAR